MYISKVFSFNGAWEKLNNNIEGFDELNSFFEVNIPHINSIVDKQFSNFNTRPNSFEVLFQEYLRSLMNLGSYIDKEFQNSGWQDSIRIDSSHAVADSLGFVKHRIAVKFEISSDTLTTFLYRKINFLNKNLSNSVDIPILVNLTEKILNEINEDLVNIFANFEKTIEELNLFLPLTFNTPFLILGLGYERKKIEIIELEHHESQKIIEHFITFEPQYFQAGLGILNYFGTVLREKYPEQKATVKIEQQDLTVRMTVEAENGDKEIIEKALHEYELVISGQTSVEEFYPTAIQTLELKNQIRILQFQLESQKEIVALKNGEILNLRALAHQALSQPQPNIKIINHNEQNIKNDYKTEINQSYEAIDELIDLLSHESIKNQLRDIQNALDHTKDKKTPEEVRDSSGFKKLGKFLKEAKDVSSNIHGVLEHTDKAAGVIEKLTKHYDKLVQFAQPFIS